MEAADLDARAELLLRCVRLLYFDAMRRTQIDLTDEQHARVTERARDLGVSKAEVVRRVLDAALGIDGGSRGC